MCAGLLMIPVCYDVGFKYFLYDKEYCFMSSSSFGVFK